MRDRVINYVLKNQVLSAILLVAAAWLIIEIRSVLIALFIAYILMSAIGPYVDFLQKKRIPKPIAVLIPYVITIGLISLLMVALLPFFINQISLLIVDLPGFVIASAHATGFKIDGPSITNLVTSEFGNVSSSVVTITTNLFGGLFEVISIFVLSFYLLVYRVEVRKSFSNLFPKKEQKKVLSTLAQAEDKLGNWLRGQVVLSGFIGAMTWLVLTILGVDFALPLAVIAGLLEIVPTIGPIVSAIPAVLVASTISIPLALVVAGAYILIQFFESHVLVPRVMQRAVGLNPIIIIIAIIIGGKLLGPIGALLAIPFVSLLVVVFKNLK